MSPLLEKANECAQSLARDLYAPKSTVGFTLGGGPEKLTHFVEEKERELGKAILVTDKHDLEQAWAYVCSCYRQEQAYDGRCDKLLPLLLQRAVKEQGLYRYIYALITKDTDEVDLYVEIYAYYAQYDKGDYILDLGRDIERKIEKREEFYLPSLRKLKAHSYIFKPQGEAICVRKCCRKDYFPFLSSIGVGRQHYGLAYWKKVLRELFAMAEVVYPASAKFALFKSIYEEGDYKKLYADCLIYMLEQLIFALDSRGNAEQREVIRTIALKELGDPRIRSRYNKWNIVKDKVRDIFIRWLSLYDLDLFFTIIRQTLTDKEELYMWQYREKFWKSYKKEIRAVWVAFSENAKQLAKKEKIISCGDYDDSKISCIIIVIDNYAFVERSHNGTLKIWREGECPVDVGERNIYRNTIQNQPAIRVEGSDRIVHASSRTFFWQKKVGGFIRDYCHIQRTERDWQPD